MKLFAILRLFTLILPCIFPQVGASSPTTAQRLEDASQCAVRILRPSRAMDLLIGCRLNVSRNSLISRHSRLPTRSEYATIINSAIR